MSRLFKVDFDKEITYLDLSKICYIQLLDEPNGFLNLEVRFPGDCGLEITARQRIDALNTERADAIRKIYRDLVFQWETYDAQQQVQVNVTPNDIVNSMQIGTGIVTSYSGTVQNSNT